MAGKIDADRQRAIFSQNLKYYMRKFGKNTADLAADLSFPFSTVSDWVHGKKYPRMDKVQALADYFGVLKSNLTEEGSDSFLPDNNLLPIPEKPHIPIPEVPQEVKDRLEDIIKKYPSLDSYGQEAVDGVLDVEWRRCTQPTQAEQPKHSRPSVTLRRPFTQVAAAEGAGAFLIDSDYDEVKVELNSFTQKADLILKVVGRSMEPEIHNGDHILVREQPSVEEGEIGVFIIDGNGFLKQSGPDRLISLNPDIDDVIIKDQQTAECYGKYICVLDPAWVVEK